ncbi:MAG: Holliday junction branch migration protein RuvA [Bacillota bacterium]|nr:Holliday junction branch migration protein RuvA [Bacillota bacterium]
MIAFIKGTVAAIEGDALVVEAGGIGYDIAVPAARLTPFPAIGDDILLHTHLQVREDAWSLFGFGDREQLRVFRLLLSVSGVGAKTALAIIDHLGVPQIAAAVAAQNVAAFTAVSGVGARTAQRLLVDLKDKFAALATIAGAEDELLAATAGENAELLAALRQLGYTATEANSFALRAQANLGADAETGVLLREALRIAMKS